MTREQKEIIAWANSVGGQFTKREAVERFEGDYYSRKVAERYVGERLSRMVKSGLLIREAPGRYRAGKGTNDPVQIELFT